MFDLVVTIFEGTDVTITIAKASLLSEARARVPTKNVLQEKLNNIFSSYSGIEPETY